MSVNIWCILGKVHFILLMNFYLYQKYIYIYSYKWWGCFPLHCRTNYLVNLHVVIEQRPEALDLQTRTLLLWLWEKIVDCNYHNELTLSLFKFSQKAKWHFHHKDDPNHFPVDSLKVVDPTKESTRRNQPLWDHRLEFRSLVPTPQVTNFAETPFKLRMKGSLSQVRSDQVSKTYLRHTIFLEFLRPHSCQSKCVITNSSGRTSYM